MGASNSAIVNPSPSKKVIPHTTTAIICSNERDLNTLITYWDKETWKSNAFYNSRLYTSTTHSQIILAGPVIGASYAIILLESLIASGIHQFIYLGWCGAISKTVKIGDVLIPTGAIIDEGTSLHYESDRYDHVPASAKLRESLEVMLTDHTIKWTGGDIWTTDGVFRETRAKVEFFQIKKALAVEMECSALFTVGRFRQVDIASILIVSDELYTFKWVPGFKQKNFKTSRASLCRVLSNLTNS